MSAGEYVLRLVRELRLNALTLEFADLAAVDALPRHHRDPFDRLLVVQAQRRNMPIVSADADFERYGIERIW